MHRLWRAAGGGKWALSSEYGTYKTVKVKFWSWLAGRGPFNIVSFTFGSGEDRLHLFVALLIAVEQEGREQRVRRRIPHTVAALLLLLAGLRVEG